jgi:outer membrane translocation and assembly module TamA
MELTPSQSPLAKLTDPVSRQGYGSLDASRTQVAAASQEQHLEMELVTAEGDRVTFSLESQSHALAVRYAEMHAVTGRVSLSKGELFASEQEQSISLTVEGDLNEQEKKDLRKVLKTLKKMMDHFVNDRLKPMLAKAKQLGNLETVAGLEVEMSYSRQVLVAEQAQINTTYNQLGALEQPSPIQPPADRPPQDQDNWQAVLQEAETLTDTMAEQMKQVLAFVEQMQESIRDMFDRFRDQVAAYDPAEPAGPDLISKMREELMAKALAQEVQSPQNDD